MNRLPEKRERSYRKRISLSPFLATFYVTMLTLFVSTAIAFKDDRYYSQNIYLRTVFVLLVFGISALFFRQVGAFLSAKDDALYDSVPSDSLLGIRTQLGSVEIEYSSPPFSKKTNNAEADANIKKIIAEYLASGPSIMEIEQIIYEKIKDNIEENLIEKLDKKYQSLAIAETIVNRIDAILLPLVRNIELCINRLQRNSIVNLLIGIGATMTAIAVLSITILSSSSDKTVFDFSLQFVPRLTFIVFIQVFAFFFLRLYKNNLEDAKYFQNELTNLNSKTASIRIAHLLGKTDKLDELLINLAAVERNFKLLKDETLLNIEKAKLEKEVDLDMLATFKDFLNSYKKDEK